LLVKKMQHQTQCQRILEQIVNLVHPKRVLVFGSSVNGKRRAHDLDFLVVVSETPNSRAIARRLYTSVRRSGIAVDFIVVTEAEYQAQREAFWSVVFEACRQGVEIYAA
jgi:predicted nucleotidyltransferase